MRKINLLIVGLIAAFIVSCNPLYAALGSLSWGVSGVCSQSLFMHYQLEASWLTAVRMVCSGILLLLITLPKDKANVFRIWTKPKDVIPVSYTHLPVLCIPVRLAVTDHIDNHVCFLPLLNQFHNQKFELIFVFQLLYHLAESLSPTKFSFQINFLYIKQHLPG